MVENASERRVHSPVAGAADPQAVLHIASTEVEVLIEAADLLKDVAAGEETGARHREKVVVPLGGPEERPFVLGRTRKEVVGEAAKPQDISGVLDSSVLGQQLRAHD